MKFILAVPLRLCGAIFFIFFSQSRKDVGWVKKNEIYFGCSFA